MRELRKGEVREIINVYMKLLYRMGRDRIRLEEVYMIAEAVKGGKLTTREKKRIAGYITKNYPKKKEAKSKIQFLIVF